MDRGQAFVYVPRVKLEQLSYRPDIEGLRAIGILLVVAFHAGLPFVTGGYIGVDVFFVLSGYLITWLLIWEAQTTGTISLRSFYARRVRRLLPASTVMLVATVGISMLLFSPMEQRYLANTAVATAAYLTNVHFARSATDYMAPEAGTNPLLHTWSLSVEEQFYLVWPLLLLAAYCWRKNDSIRLRPTQVLVSIAALVSFSLCVWLTFFRHSLAFFLPVTRAWEFAFGGLLVLFRQPLQRVLVSGSSRQVLSWVGFGGLAACAVSFNERTHFPGFAALGPSACTALLLVACEHPGTFWGRTLGSRAMQWIGQRSYAWYLWHWPLLVFAGLLGSSQKWIAVTLAVGASLAIAHLSYTFVEMPVRHAKWFSGPGRRTLRVGVALMVHGLLMAGAWRALSSRWMNLPAQAPIVAASVDLSQVYSQDCDRLLNQADLRVCTYGAKSAENTVVVVGDSHAGQWYPAFRWVEQKPGWRVAMMFKSACPMVEADVYLRYLRRNSYECAAWREQALEKIEELQPRMVVVAYSKAYDLTEDEWLLGTKRVEERLSRMADSVVLLRDVSRLDFSVPQCLARSQWLPGVYAEANCQASPRTDPGLGDRAMIEVAELFPNMHYVDFTEVMCPNGRCPLAIDGIPIYRDNTHITASYAASVSSEMERRLGQFLTQP